MKKLLLPLLVWILCFSDSYGAAKKSNPLIAFNNLYHPVVGQNGMVSSQEAVATQIGLDVLKGGGNAIDAAVATGYALAVTLPKAGNIGGGGFAVIYSAKDKKTYSFDFREMAPKASHRDLFLNNKGDVDTKRARYSTQSAGVPGTVAGFETIRKRFGTQSLQKLIQPSISLARDGITVTAALEKDLIAYQKRLSKSPEIKKIFYPNGQPLKMGDLLVQKDLSWSLQQISDHGPKAFYEGEIAKKVINFMSQKNGIMTMEDLKNYKVAERTPVQGSYKNYTVVSMPPPSSGGIHVIQMLNILEPYELKNLGHNSAASLHRIAESMKLAYADRSEHLGDPDYYNVPIQGLQSKEYADFLRHKIKLYKATPSTEIKPGKAADYESEQTTHYSVMDKEGNIASITYTLNFSFGNRQIAPGTGFILNNEMVDFSAKTGFANAFGLLGGEANAIEPGKRPLSSMTPTIVLKDGKPFMVTGSPGGSKIITAVLQTILNVIEFDMNIAEASNVPRIHHQWYPDELKLEKGISVDTSTILSNMGHHIKDTTGLGSTQSIIFDNGKFYGSSDPRRPGALTLAF